LYAIANETLRFTRVLSRPYAIVDETLRLTHVQSCPYAIVEKPSSPAFQSSRYGPFYQINIVIIKKF